MSLGVLYALAKAKNTLWACPFVCRVCYICLDHVVPSVTLDRLVTMTMGRLVTVTLDLIAATMVWI
jgi:hypothetical protein